LKITAYSNHRSARSSAGCSRMLLLKPSR
jgi:hypothetical protein